MAAATEYLLEPVRDDEEFTFYRARRHGDASPVPVITPAAETADG